MKVRKECYFCIDTVCVRFLLRSLSRSFIFRLGLSSRNVFVRRRFRGQGGKQIITILQEGQAEKDSTLRRERRTARVLSILPRTCPLCDLDRTNPKQALNRIVV